MRLTNENFMNSLQTNRVLLFFTFILIFPLVSKAMPSATENFRFEVYSDTAAELFWSRSTDIHIQGYEITRNDSNLGIFDALSYFDDTLMPGVEYTYTISTVAANGERSTASTVSLQTPQFANTIASIQQANTELEQEIDTLSSFLNSGVRSPVPQTGQTNSIHPGDDGDYQYGVTSPTPRFTTNVRPDNDTNGNGMCDGDELCSGTVTDNLTGLIWLKHADCFGARSWPQAINDAANLADDGTLTCGLNDESQVGDWRLPNVNEILSLMDYGRDFPDPLLPLNHPFTDIQIGGVGALPSSYWTSTNVGNSSDYVYTVSISVGWVDAKRHASESSIYSWFVRGGL